MTFEIFLAFSILITALIVFALDIYPIDFVAFSIMALILLLGPILGVSPLEAISGFSNPATITVMAMFILSAGVYRTGLINVLAHRMVKFAGESQRMQLITVMLVVGPISAFINNTAAVAILIPSVISLAHQHKQAPSKLLIPLSYFSQLAGVVTLIGTSTNILASSITAQEGYEAFGMFEFASIGILVFITGAIYILFIGSRLLPERRADEQLAESYQIKEYMTEVLILENSPLIGKTLVESRFSELFDINILDIYRRGQNLGFLIGENTDIRAGDILFVQAKTEQLLNIKDEEGLAFEPEVRLGSADGQNGQVDAGLMEVVIGPDSTLIGGTLETTNFRNRYNCTVIAVQSRGELIHERLGQLHLSFGDTLLLRGETFALEQIKREPGFIVTQEMQEEEFRGQKVPLALGIIGGVVVFAALGVPILVTAIGGCVLMVVTGCLKVEEFHGAIRWDVIFLLAGVIPLGLALQNTGGADWLASQIVNIAYSVPPLLVLILFYFMTTIFTELISNNATVVVLVPIGIATAIALGLDPRAIVLVIMFAASTSFMTPVGYQTNTLVFGPGGYKFLDYLRVGGLLNLLLAFITPIYIYFIWGV